jgi:glutathione synthase/RimK-type ligase-like ATP-grasp enzyme
LRIALVTCERPVERDDDLDFLVPALKRRGVEVETPGWSDPTVDWGSFSVAMISSTWDYGDRQPEFRSWLRQAARVTRLRNPLDVVEWNFDKRYLRELAEAGVPTIPTVWSEPGEEERAWAEVERLGWDRVVIKPVVDLNAQNLVRVPPEHVLAMLGRFEVPVMVQPFLPAVSAGELSLVYLAGELSHCLRKIPARGDFRVQPQYGGTHEAATAPAAALEVATRALAAAPGEPLYARVDLLDDDAGKPALIELELIEPSLYLDVKPTAADSLAAALLAAAAQP